MCPAGKEATAIFKGDADHLDRFCVNNFNSSVTVEDSNRHGETSPLPAIMRPVFDGDPLRSSPFAWPAYHRNHFR